MAINKAKEFYRCGPTSDRAINEKENLYTESVVRLMSGTILKVFYSMSEIKFQYALDENGKLVNINSLTSESRRLHTYRCIGCGNILLPRAISSLKRRPHFYHKEQIECSGETYLHKLGKRIIKERFVCSEHFYISYPVTVVCSNSCCTFRRERCKEDNKRHKVDLKEFYDTCQEEVAINGFVADLLLTSSNNPNCPPILIEICVSHACEEEKRNSGLKIIEIKIRDEFDLDNIFLDGVLREIVPSLDVKFSNVEFISFKREIQKKITVPITRYIYIPQCIAEGYLTQIDCSDVDFRIRKNSSFELNVVSNSYCSPELENVLHWLYKYKGFCRCNICKFYYATSEEFPICRLSKKYGKPKYPNTNFAEQCGSFGVVDREFLNEDFSVYEVPATYRDEKKEYKVIIAGSSGFHDKSTFMQKVDYYLSGKIKTHNVILLAGTSMFTKELILEYAKKRNIHIEPHNAKWGKYYENGAMDTIDEMINEADAVIAFWNGKGTITGELIKKAQLTGIKCKIIKY